MGTYRDIGIPFEYLFDQRCGVELDQG